MEATKQSSRLPAREVLRREYGDSKNFITPHVLGIGWIEPGRVAYELSTGTDFDHAPMYGVSLVRLNPDGRTERLGESKCFTGQDAREQARRYIRDQKRGAK